MLIRFWITVIIYLRLKGFRVFLVILSYHFAFWALLTASIVFVMFVCRGACMGIYMTSIFDKWKIYAENTESERNQQKREDEENKKKKDREREEE